MTQIFISDASYRQIATMAQERELTPAQFIEAIVSAIFAQEVETETQEWLADAEAMDAVRALRESDAQGKPVTGQSWEQFKTEQGWTA